MTTNKIPALLCMLVFAACFTGCKKDGNTTGNPTPAPTPVAADIYVAGYESDGTVTTAKLWKNGTAYNISDGTRNAGATGVYVSGQDVYVCFNEMEGSRNRPKLWKNGVVSTLTFPGINETFAISAANAVYKGVVAGYFQSNANGPFTAAAYWDDNGSHQISAINNNAEAYGIHIKTSNNFTRTSLAGNVEIYENGISQKRAFFFGNQSSNPTLNILSGGQAPGYGYACFINDNGFTYTAGRYDGSPTIWLEGGTSITLSNNLGTAYALYVSGYTQVYVVGNELVNGKYVARLWSGDYQTSQLQSVTLGNGQYQSNASGIQVVDGNTFVCGDEYDATGKSYAKYWKNGTPVILGSAGSYATAIYVVKK